MPLEPGDRLGPYKIQALLGVGGMGEVYRARDTRLGRDVALKVISPRLIGDPSRRERFEREARAAAALNHPSIVTIHDVGETGDVAWIAMEWVEGRTLRQALADGPLSVRDAWSITRQIAEGLATAHAKGVVHRDLKPENIMLAADGRAKILDFGVARHNLATTLEASAGAAETVAASHAPTLEGVIVGTVGYMSPEQASGRAVDFRSDQFALGLLAYEILAGRRAFERATAVETLSAIIREDPVPLPALRPDIPDAFHAVIARCFAKLPDDRFASTRDLAMALESVGAVSSLATGAPVAAATPPVAPPQAAPRLHPIRLAVLLAAAALVLALLATTWYRSTAPGNAIQSLAVLPFDNAGTDPDTDYLGDGITESLIDQMSRVPSLRVMARGTVFRFRGAEDPQQVGMRLRVGAVLTGSVLRRGDQVTISAELIETSTGIRLWGETYDRPLSDLLQVQDSIASEIADGLRLRLSGAEKRTIGGYGTDNYEAYGLLLKGRELMRHDTEEDDLEARRLFQQALEKDPKFIEAHLGVASTYVRSAGNGYAPPAEAWARAAEQVQKVLALEPDNLQARVALASRRFMYDWDWAAAEREYREISADPRLFQGIQYHAVAIFLWARGRSQEAVALMERALRIDPENVESRIMMADFLAHAGRLDEALAHYQAIGASDPEHPSPWFGIAEILKGRGDIRAAIEALRRAYELSGEEHGAQALATASTEQDYEKAEIAVARVRLADLEALAKERYVSPLDLARLHARVGNREEAFRSLESAIAERSPALVHLKMDRAWDGVRGHARFAAVVRRVGIP